MKQSLSLRVSQHLSLTPQLQQSIRLLQLSTLEMAQEVEQMLDENPFLERSEEQAEREAFGVDAENAPVSTSDQLSEWSADSAATPSASNDSDDFSEEVGSSEPDWEGDGTVSFTPDDGEWGGEAAPRTRNDADDETASAAELASEHISLQAHLHQQALGLRLNEEERAALYFLIESLNDDGYLDEPVAALAAALAGDDLEAREATEQALNLALHWLQHMDPAGVGARDLAECLRLQIEELRNSPAAQAALAMCAQPLDLLARRDAKRLAAACRLDEAVVREGLALISRLEPKPGRRFVNVERNTILPDVIVTKAGRGFKVQLNPDVMPRLRVHDIYANALRQGRGDKGEGAAGMQQRLQEARWFIKNIQQRFDTILRVSSAIVERQRNFFMHGELAMRPLVLREIADELGLHESTISRVTTAKYMATPFGTFELKYFFGSSLGTETGGNASSTAVRALIKQFVASEDAAKPLSDNQLSEMLKEQGIECARRTVAKYREALRIAPANLRKR
jgi:RNA polymerase sigma-54 factor